MKNCTDMHNSEVVEEHMDLNSEVGMDNLQEVDDAGIRRNYHTGMEKKHHNYPSINTPSEFQIKINTQHRKYQKGLTPVL